MSFVSNRISVVMACFNTERFVAEAVRSVLAQTWPDTELIVVDDGSTDRSLTALGEFGEQIRVITQQNQGPYPARNRGAAAATGEFLAFLDADDWWDATCLAKLHAALSEEPDAAVAYCGWQNVGVSGGRGEPYIPPDYEADGKLQHLLASGAPWPIHAALVRRSAFVEVGGFRTTLRTSMDYDFWLRLAASRRIVRVSEVLAYYRFHQEGQISSQPWRQVANAWRIKRDFLESDPCIASQLSSASKEEWLDRTVIRRGQQFYWQRELRAAQQTFRFALRHGLFKGKDLKFILPAVLPFCAYSWLVRTADRVIAGK